ncbi:MAG TPA: N-acetyltransferase family protein [Caldilineaceae bacterium]|nr:N-acetyltransferase family protein [Caldilineaceae bacterium]
MHALEIRPVVLADVPAINQIYSESVLTWTASWELTPPDDAEMTKRVQSLLSQGYPYVVGIVEDRLVGYSYASSYRARPGYRFTVENSIYVDPAYQRRGIARALMQHVIDACTAKGYRQMVAVIGDSENHASIALHQRLGFTKVAMLPNLGFKFGRWLDSVMMQRALGEGGTTLPVE